jgi:hypothetical protein
MITMTAMGSRCSTLGDSGPDGVDLDFGGQVTLFNRSGKSQSRKERGKNE